jgi:hypothetical protein
MQSVSVDLFHVLVAAIVYFAIGGLWYSQAVFGKSWGDALGKKMSDFSSDARRNSMVAMAVAALVLNYFLAMFVGYAQASSLMDGVTVGFYVWLGFVVTSLLSTYMFEGRKMKLYYLFVGYQFVGLLVSGAILAAWH